MQFDWIDVASKLGFPAAVTAFLLIMLPRALGKIHSRIDASSEGINRRLEQIAYLLGKLSGPGTLEEARSAFPVNGENTTPK